MTTCSPRETSAEPLKAELVVVLAGRALSTAGLKRHSRRSPRWLTRRKQELERRQHHLLEGARAAEAEPEGDVEREKVEPEEPCHRPEAEDEEGDARPPPWRGSTASSGCGSRRGSSDRCGRITAAKTGRAKVPARTRGSLAAVHAVNITRRCPFGSQPRARESRRRTLRRAADRRREAGPAPRRPKPVDRRDPRRGVPAASARRTPSRRASSSTSIPTRSSSRSCSRRSRPTPASTRRRASSSALADTPQKMLALGEDGVREHIKTLNFLNTKAQERDRPVAPPRRGARRRGAVLDRGRSRPCPASGARARASSLNIAFGEPRIAVDTHIFRVANRIPLVATEDAARDAGAARADRAGGVPAPCPPLADPARALRLQGAPARSATAA